MADNRRNEGSDHMSGLKARWCGSSHAWLPVGVGIGAAMGSATGEMGVWVALGAAIGMALSIAQRRRR